MASTEFTYMGKAEFGGFTHNATGANITLYIPDHTKLGNFRAIDSEHGLANHVIELTYGGPILEEQEANETEAQLLDWGDSRKKGPYVKLRIPRERLEYFEGLANKTQTQPGTELFISIMMADEDVQEERQLASSKKPKGRYGDQARTLHQSGFFRTPAVWAAIGTDEQYNQWVKRQKSAYSGQYSEFNDNGDAYCVPAHYRRVSAGSGTGVKPPYSTIPLTDREHQQQHQHGYSILGGEGWWQAQRIRHVERWARITLREQLGFDSWSQISPAELSVWSIEHGVERYLPRSIFDQQARVAA